MWFDSPSVWSSQTWHQWWVQSCDIILTGAWWQNPSGFEQGRPSWYPTSKSLCSQTSVFLIFWIFHNLVRWNLTYIGLYGAVDEGLWSLNVVTWEGPEDTWSNASVYWVCIHSQCSSVVFVMEGWGDTALFLQSSFLSFSFWSVIKLYYVSFQKKKKVMSMSFLQWKISSTPPSPCSMPLDMI